MAISNPVDNRRRAIVLALLLVAGTAAGWLATHLHVPLGWTIGPLLVTAVATILLDLPAPPVAMRFLGQLVVGGAVGLYLTPEALERVLANGPAMVLGALGVSVSAALLALALIRFRGADPVTTLYATVPGGPLEMAILAEGRGGDPARVALSQTIRIVAIVLILPPLLTIGVGSRAPDAAVAWTFGGGALLLAFSAVAGLVSQRVRLSNPFFLGPMIAVGAVVATGLPMPHHPVGVVPGAQVLLGISLGGMFRRSILIGSGRFVAVTLATTAFLMAATGLVTLGLIVAFGGDYPTVLLANAPGAVTEMVITAKALDLDVPLVASYQFVRILVGLSVVALFFRIVRWMARRPH